MREFLQLRAVDDFVLDQAYQELFEGAFAEAVENLLHGTHGDVTGLVDAAVDKGFALDRMLDIALFRKTAQDRSDGRVFQRMLRREGFAKLFGCRGAPFPEDIHEMMLQFAESGTGLFGVAFHVLLHNVTGKSRVSRLKDMRTQHRMIGVTMWLLIAAMLIVNVPARAAEHWTRLSTTNFELYTTASEKEGRSTILHFEQVREFFQQASPVRSQGDFPVRIIQFETESQYKPFQPAEHVPAYFTETPQRDYIVIGDRAAQDYTPSIHEYMHVVVRRSGLKLPLWLNEGWADVFSTLRPMGKDMAVGDLLPERMKSLANDKWMEFDALTAVDRNSPSYHEGARAGIFYAESWALTHMLFLAPEYKDKFRSFVMALNSGKSAQEACQIAFGRSSRQVFRDLRTYFDRKKIFGTVFETRIDKRPVKIEAAGVADFDSRLMLADLMAANNNQNGAQIQYAKLEQEAPARADLLASIGYMALSSRDRETARGYFERAYAAGSADSKMCYELAMLDNAAKAPAARVMPILERALKARPDFTEAKAQLGLLKVNTRDFAGGVAILTSIPTVTPQIAPAVLCMLAYADIQTGDVEGARQNIEGCRKWSKTAEETERAEKIGKFVEARSNPAVAVRPGEQVRRLTGIARNVECSDEGNRLQVSVGSKLITFDLPAVEAVELPLKPKRPVSLACGPMQPAEIGVEYAPPRSAMETSIGIVRRLNY